MEGQTLVVNILVAFYIVLLAPILMRPDEFHKCPSRPNFILLFVYILQPVFLNFSDLLRYLRRVELVVLVCWRSHPCLPGCTTEFGGLWCIPCTSAAQASRGGPIMA